MPIATGIIIGCVPKQARNSASALYAVSQNVIGLSLAPVLSGHIMEQYKSKREGMIAGYSMLLYCGIVLTLLFMAARSIVKREMKKLTKLQSQEDDL